MQEQNDSATITPYKETELKEDLLVIQFKIVNKETFKTNNSFTFINLPLAKVADNNVSTLLEILKKSKKTKGSKKASANNKNDFLPYNKSILTRVVA